MHFTKKIFSAIFISGFSILAHAQQVSVSASAGISTSVVMPTYNGSGYHAHEEIYNSPGGQERYYANMDSAPRDPIKISHAGSYDGFEYGGTYWNPSGYRPLEASVEVGFQPQPYLKLSASPDSSGVLYSNMYSGVRYEDHDMDGTAEPYVVTLSDTTTSRTPEASASLRYSFQIKSTPNAVIPVHFSGVISFDSAISLAERREQQENYESMNQAGIVLNYRTAGGTSSEVGYDISLKNTSTFNYYTWERDYTHAFELTKYWTHDSDLTMGGSDVTPGGNYWVSDFAVLVHGTFNTVADEYGNAWGWVDLTGYARGGTTFVDPFLEIDQAFLAEHPDSQIILPTGVGNAPTVAVPEPSALLLCLTGLAGLMVHLRRSGSRLRRI